MSRNHRQDYHRAWNDLTPPLRPNHEVAAAVKAELAGIAGPVLLLGVTPELADASADLVALDRNLPMVRHIWPGDTASRRAVVGDWRIPCFAAGTFSACIGDGSLSALSYPDQAALALREIRTIMRDGGRFVCRLFLAPDTAESIAAIRDLAASRAISHFHTCKLRLAMALSAQRPQPVVRANDIRDCFNDLFPDRDALVRATGWVRAQIDTIDHYQGSVATLSFPTREQVQSAVAEVFADVRLVRAGRYELAERCPLLVAERRG